jgi:hypothetical protein
VRLQIQLLQEPAVAQDPAESVERLVVDGADKAGVQQQFNAASLNGRATAARMAAATAPAAATAAATAVAGGQGRVAGSAKAAAEVGQVLAGERESTSSPAGPAQDHAWDTAGQRGHSRTSALSATAAAEVMHANTGARRLKSDFASLIATLPDVESLMSEGPSSITGGNSLLTAAEAQADAAVAVAIRPLGSSAVAGTGGNTGGITGLSPLAANCFYLPVEICLIMRRGNLQVVAYAYPYVLGYLAVAAINIMQTLMTATKTGALVLDAQLLVILAQQLCLVVALLGGLGLVVSLDRLYRMLPM